MARCDLAERLFMETDAYVELQSVLGDERSAIIERDYKRLHDLMARKDALVARISGLAQTRGSLDAVLRDGSGSAGGKGDGVRRAARALIEAARVVRRMNEENSRVIRASLKNVKSALELLESFRVSTTYSGAGRVHSEPIKGASLRKGV